MIIVKGVPQKINNLRSVNEKNLFIMLFWKKTKRNFKLLQCTTSKRCYFNFLTLNRHT